MGYRSQFGVFPNSAGINFNTHEVLGVAVVGLVVSLCSINTHAVYEYHV